MKQIGELIVEYRSSLSEEQQALKEKEGVFDMKAEEAQIAQVMQSLHGPPIATPQA